MSLNPISWFTKEPETIAIPLQDARNLYATIATIVSNRLDYVEQMIQSERLTAVEARQFSQDRAALRDVHFHIKKAIENPKAEVDWAKVGKALEIVAKLVGAVL